jgi:serine/threonine-protein kinase RsbW
MGETIWTMQGRFVPDPTGVITGTDVSLTIPAGLDYLAIVSELVGEYCAALPTIFAQQNIENPHHEVRARRFGTSTLTLPGEGKVIESSYSHFVYSVQLVLQEASTNVLRHGYNDENGFTLNITLSAALLKDEKDYHRQALVMELVDTAPPFDITGVTVQQPDPLELQEGGYGLYLIHRLTDKMEYTRKESRNHLKMIKYIGD